MNRNWFFGWVLMLLLGLAGGAGCGNGGGGGSPSDSLLTDTTIVDTGSVEFRINRLTQQLRFSPNNYNLYYERSKLFYESGNTVQAMMDIDKCILNNVTWPDGYHLRGFYFYVQNQDSSALEDFRRSAELGSENPETFLNIGNIFLLQKKYKESALAYEDAIKLDSTQPAGYFAKGYLYEEQKQYDKALKAYDDALRWDRTYVKAWARAHDIFLNVKKDEGKAYEMNARILELDSLHPLGRFNQGNFFLAKAERITDPEKELDFSIMLKLAISEYGRCLAVDSRFEQAWYNRAYCYYQLEKFGEALRDLDKVTELNPYHDKAFFLKGSIFEYQGNLESALSNYEMALKVNPDFGDAERAVAEVKARLGRKKEK